MVVIFGWGRGDADDRGEVAPLQCPHCHNGVFLHWIKSNKQVSLFFVPLYSYGTDEYLACPICHTGLQLKPGQRALVERMHQTTSLYRRGGFTEDVYRANAERFWAEMDVPWSQAVGGAAPAAQVGASTGDPTAPPEVSISERLLGLARLNAQGVLTDEEFAAAKRRLLGD